jgi:hypothetical protein
MVSAASPPLQLALAAFWYPELIDGSAGTVSGFAFRVLETERKERPMTDPVRSAGPDVVTAGDPDGPTLVVLDPAGAAKHDELPASWRSLAAHRRIVWCRLPVDGALSAADEILSEARGVDVVASGPFAEEALRLAARYPGAARHILLVDPAADAGIPAEHATAADDDWLSGHEEPIASLREAGTEVEVIAHSTGGSDDRVAAPLPLGHPDVVAGLTRVLGIG